MEYKEVKGDLIELTKLGMFDVIAHGCNCLCTMRAGIAPQMAKAFGVDKYNLEHEGYKGDINKLGQIESDYLQVNNKVVAVVNAYTQFSYGRNHSDGVSKPLDYEALTLCLRKINSIFKGKHIGLPWIGCGLAGGSKSIVKKIIKSELVDCKVTIVEYNK